MAGSETDHSDLEGEECAGGVVGETLGTDHRHASQADSGDAGGRGDRAIHSHAHGGHTHGNHAHAAHSHAGLGHSHYNGSSFGAPFAAAVALNLGIVAAEIIGGLAGGSVALVSDAVHNMSDVIGLLVAFGAHALGRYAPTKRFTYGLGNGTILAALFNAVLLLVVTGALTLDAIQHLFRPVSVQADITIVIALVAIAVNGLSAWLLSGNDGDVNIKAAAAHLAADAAVAVGVVCGALLIRLTGAVWIDPVLSIAINAMIVLGTWRLLREALTLSLAGVPAGVEPDRVRAYLAGLPGVTTLHDLHIWPMSTTRTALTVHLLMPGGHPGDVFLQTACETLRDHHGIAHATVQIETMDGDCMSAACTA